MAHALFAHDGLCRNIHGHTYHLYITLAGLPRREFGHPKDGMIIDFSELKTLIHRKVISRYDHALLLNAGSPNALQKELGNNFERIVYVDFQPTCENLLIDLVEKLKHAFPEGVELFHIRLQETPNSSAEWFKSDNEISK